MAKYTDPKCRLCRREGTKLYLKGARCLSPKCPIDKKGAQVPGMHGKKRARGRISGFGTQLREKQKAKRTYGVLEGQFHKYYDLAIKSSGNSSEVIMQLLESRLDNVCYRMGFVSSRSLARQLVSHGNILVDGKKVDVPSFLTKTGMTISLPEKAQKFDFVAPNLNDKNIPAKWMSRKGATGKIDRMPTADEIGSEIKTNLIIEYYSR
jgi:small subunit ribosomal protein S4